MTIAYVNGNTGTDDSESSTIAADAINAISGNAIVVCVSSWFESGAIAVSGVADTAANSYSRMGSAYVDGNFLVEFWLAQNIAGNASNVVTATFAASTTYRRIHVLHFSGVALSSAHDTAFAPAGNVDSTSPYTPTAANTAVDGEMIIGFATYQESGVTYSSSAPSVLRLQNDAIATFTNLIASAGSGSASVAGSVSGAHWCYSKAIKPAAGATTISIYDAGAGADAIAQLAAALALSDAGAGADGFSGQAALAVADSAAGADGIGPPVAVLQLADAGAGTDAIGSPTVVLQLADAAAGADLIQFVQALLQAADSGAGIDGLSIAVNLSLSDAAAGADTAAAYVLIQISDAGSTADAVVQIAAALSIADAGAGIDALAQILASLTLPDSGAGIDSISVVQGGDVKIIYDAATGADSLGIVVQIALADSAASADLVAQLRVALLISDSGAGVDAASLAGRLASIVDSGMGADLVGGISVSLILADAGAAADMVAQVLARLSVSDAGMGADTAAVITFLAHGKIRITFTARRPVATLTAKRPGMAMTARRPGVTFH